MLDTLQLWTRMSDRLMYVYTFTDKGSGTSYCSSVHLPADLSSWHHESVKCRAAPGQNNQAIFGKELTYALTLRWTRDSELVEGAQPGGLGVRLTLRLSVPKEASKPGLLCIRAVVSGS